MNYKNNIKVSIVVPIYNVEPFIKQCLDSLINQTLKEIEIILIDDNSPDNSDIICNEYATKDKRIVVIHNEKNIGQGLSSNKGIEIARGEYLGFVDPDDWVDLDFFEKLYTTAKKNKSDIAKTERIKVFSDGSIETQKNLNDKIKKGIKNKTPIFLLFNYEHTTAIYRREVLIKNKVLYPNIRNSQDVVFLLMATYFSESLSIISKTYYYYRQHTNSTVAVREKLYFESKLSFFSLYLDFINTHQMEKHYYDLVFLIGYNSVRIGYEKIDDSYSMHNFKSKYAKRVIEIITKYKYTSGYLLDSFVIGFTNGKQIQQLKKSKAYRIGMAITWLPSKIKNLLKQDSKK